MQIVKLLRLDTIPFFNDFEGIEFNLPSEKDSLDNFQLPEVVNDCIYIIEAAPDYSNPLNYDGVNIALKIYFQAISKNINKFRIILLGYEDKASFFQFCLYSNILKCPGVIYLHIGSDTIIESVKNDLSDIDLDYARQNIINISIKPPSGYKSHHSIANEWALLRYFSMFEVDDQNELYLSLKNKLYEIDYKNTLHFKHTEAKSSRQKFKPNRHSIKPIIKGIENTKIGIIDDEINKGWIEYYNYILDKSLATAVPYNNFQKDYEKRELINQIENWLLEKITSNDPIDIFIVDLRLHNDDFEEKDFEKLSGIQIIKFLKSKNPGIQVIVSTASNKVWNYQKCLDAGVKYFSVKEAPETFNTRSETIASFHHFSMQVSRAVKDIYLADLFRKIEVLKHQNIFANFSGEKDKEFANLTFGKNGLLEQIFNLLILDSASEAIINQCLLLSFQILENYCNLSSVGNFGSDNSHLSSGYIWRKENNQIQVFVTQSTQISTRLELVYGNFALQTDHSYQTPISFNAFENMELRTVFRSGLDSSSLVKMISILHFRENFLKDDIEKLMELRYYRSNVAAHLTGNINADPAFKITSSDIVFFINKFKKIFIKATCN